MRCCPAGGAAREANAEHDDAPEAKTLSEAVAGERH